MNWQLPCGAHPLAPFDHQVAGQSSMLRYDNTTVCKPLIAREHFVYKSLPSGLKEFTPEYRGEIEVRLAEKDGFLLLYGLSVNDDSHHTPCDWCLEEGLSHASGAAHNSGRGAIKPDAVNLKSVRPLKDQCMIRVLESENYEVCPPVQEMSQGDATAQHPSGLNPWSLKNHKRLLDKMRKSEHSQNHTGFMLLNNVVADFKYPCILDLKIGSRLHGDEADLEKVESQSQKCRETTSSTIGVRLCGMQVFQKDTGTYSNYDKYHGRTLKDDTFKKALISFLHNGTRSRTELVQPIVSQLSRLIQCLENVDSYRFYASSLLIIYDGEEEGDLLRLPSPHSVDAECSIQNQNSLSSSHQVTNLNKTLVKNCEPSQTTYDTRQPYLNDCDSRESNCDSSYASTSDSEKQVLSHLQDDSQDGNCSSTASAVSSSLPPSQFKISHQRLACEQFDSEELNLGCRESLCEPSLHETSKHGLSGKVVTAEGQQSGLENHSTILPWHGKVYVKMIDFAHTTHKGFPKDKVRHEGPDTDYIRGLTNLRELFQQLTTLSSS